MAKHIYEIKYNRIYEIKDNRVVGCNDDYINFWNVLFKIDHQERGYYK